MSAVLVYITASNVAEAESIGKMLVEKRLAACVNLIEGMRSFFWWQGQLDQARETVLIAKTKTGLIDELTAVVRASHSYDCPCIVALPIIGGHPDFIQWIQDETK